MFENGTRTTASCGCKVWKNKNDKLHRLDGPAIEKWGGCPKQGDKSFFWIDGTPLSEEEYNQCIERMRQDVLRRLEEAFIKCYIWCGVQHNHELYDLVASYERQLPNWMMTGQRSVFLNEYLEAKGLM